MAAADVQEMYASAPGNWLAQEIRRFQEQSKGLFPDPQPGDEKLRYNTIYGLEYTNLNEGAYKTDTPMLLRRPGLKKETPFSLEQAKRFNTWKVRNDMVDVERVQQRVAERRKTAQEAAVRRQETDNKLNLPTIGRGHTVAGEMRPKPSQQQPQIRTPTFPPGHRSGVAQSVSGSVRGGRVDRHSDSRHSLPGGLARDSQSRYKNIKQDLLDAAEDYMQKNPQAERRVIDKALMTSNKHYNADPKTIKTELPNAKHEAAKWLEQATEEEQELAVQFFRSVGGMRLMGLGGKVEEKRRLQNLLSTLESGEAGVASPRLNHADEQKRRERKQRNLQFMRLLSPNAKATRHQYQSWHHLPTYRPLNRADNPRSHFTQPQKVKPLHFTIHPDWGP